MGRTEYTHTEPLSEYDARIFLIEIAEFDLSHSEIVPMINNNGKKVPVVVHIGDDDGSVFASHNN